MTSISKETQAQLAERFVIGRPEVVEAQVSTDGMRKWLLRSADGQDYEMVFIPDADRGTLCVSSQVGCTLNCRFCYTGTMKLVRNLTAGEVVRSEEHTSELQSLMRISYAVFCLKKKKNQVTQVSIRTR